MDWSSLSYLMFFLVSMFGVAGIRMLNDHLEWKRGQADSSPPKDETPVQRLDRLIRALRQAVVTIREVETEVQARQALADRLMRSVEEAEALSGNDSETADAVAQALQGVIKKDRRRGLWQDVLIGALFFVLGIIATVVSR